MDTDLPPIPPQSPDDALITAVADLSADPAATDVITDLRQQPITEVARHQVIVPCEGTSHFPSLTPAMAVVHGLLAEIAKQLGDAGRRSTTHIESLWAEMGVMYEP